MRIRLFVLGIGAAAASSGCTDVVRIEGSDSSVNAPYIRGSFAVGNSANALQDRGRIDLTYVIGKGEFNSDVDDGRTAVVANTAFNGPVTIHGSVTLSESSVRYARDSFSGQEPLGFAWTVGFAHLHLDADFSAGDQSVHHSQNSEGLSAGIGLAARSSGLDFLFRINAIEFFLSSNAAMTEYEAIGSYALTPVVTASGGWRWWHYSLDGDPESDITLDYSGPTAGLQLSF